MLKKYSTCPFCGYCAKERILPVEQYKLIKMKRLIYLAAPYTFSGTSAEEVVAARVLAINKFAADIFINGDYCFSPISHTHPIKEVANLCGGFEFWRDYYFRMIRHCNELWVLQLDGWDKSGVTAEIEYAISAGKPVQYRLPNYYAILKSS
jgi:nucleoside 2-deoxyribosyltransferase